VATLEELAGLAALIMGSRQQNKQINRANQYKLDQQAKEDRHRQALLDYRIGQDKNETQRAGEAQKQKERMARIAQLRMAYMPLLNMGRTAQERDELARIPGQWEALRQDQADIAQLIATGDDSVWENFRPRFYGGQGFVPPPPQETPDASGAAPSTAPFGIQPEQMMPRGGPMGTSRQQPAAPPSSAPSPMMTTDPLGNPLAAPIPMDAQPSAAQPGMDPLGNPLAALFGPPKAQPGSFFSQPVPVPRKDAATIANLTSQTNERNAMLQHEINEAIANKNYKVAQTKLAQLAQLTEREKPGLVRAQTKATESLPGYRTGQLKIGEERNKQGWASLDLQEKLGYARIHSAEGIAAANRAAKSSAGPQVPEGSKPFVTKLAALATATLRQASGSERPLTQEEREAQAAQINAEHDRAFGIPLFGPDGVLSTANVTTGAGTPAPTAKPSAGGGLPAGITEAQVQAVAGLSSADYNAAFAAATPDEKRLLKAARGAAMRRKGR
jgi:hypothetical protein